jgi:hypothetical protein
MVRQRPAARQSAVEGRGARIQLGIRHDGAAERLARAGIRVGQGRHDAEHRRVPARLTAGVRA